MSRYEFRFVVDGGYNEDGEIEFTIDHGVLDETVWDREDEEWREMKWVDDSTLAESDDVLFVLEKRLNA